MKESTVGYLSADMLSADKTAKEQDRLLKYECKYFHPEISCSVTLKVAKSCQRLVKVLQKQVVKSMKWRAHKHWATSDGDKIQLQSVTPTTFIQSAVYRSGNGAQEDHI